jgi:hypothetical protein
MVGKTETKVVGFAKMVEAIKTMVGNVATNFARKVIIVALP